VGVGVGVCVRACHRMVSKIFIFSSLWIGPRGPLELRDPVVENFGENCLIVSPVPLCGLIINTVESGNDTHGDARPILTSWRRVLPEKLTGSQLVKIFPTFYGTPRFIIAFTTSRHLSLS